MAVHVTRNLCSSKDMARVNNHSNSIETISFKPLGPVTSGKGLGGGGATPKGLRVVQWRCTKYRGDGEHISQPRPDAESQGSRE